MEMQLRWQHDEQDGAHLSKEIKKNKKELIRTTELRFHGSDEVR